MKAVLISIQPKWVEKIANGEKTIEVRKTVPNCAALCESFKCYIYCTNTPKYHHLYDLRYRRMFFYGYIPINWVNELIKELQKK